MLDDLDAAERIRKDLLTQLLDEDRAALHEAILRAVRDRGDSESELRFRSGGRGRWIRVRIRLLSRAGNLSNLYLLAEETTQEQALRDRLAATRDTIPGGLAFYEVADRIRLLDFSDAAADMIGYTREEYQARTLDDAFAVVHPEDRARVEAVAAELDAGASRSSCTMRAMRGDGEVAWLHLSASTMYRDETALYVVAVLIDVTNEKENEQRLKAQSELQCPVERFRSVRHRALYGGRRAPRAIRQPYGMRDIRVCRFRCISCWDGGRQDRTHPRRRR